jgi:hypothetical protein
VINGVAVNILVGNGEGVDVIVSVADSEGGTEQEAIRVKITNINSLSLIVFIRNIHVP